MPTKAELKAKGKKVKLKVRTGDKVVIIAGKDKGQVGFVAAISPEKLKAIVLQENEENPEQPNPLNAATKHFKAKYQGQKSARIRIPVPIHISNLMVIDPATNEPSRIGRRTEEGKIVRYAKKSGKTIVDTPNMSQRD
ncbi:MAG: 50S ribosomal protein L24 [Fimbriimonadaceae bacterium]|nr:50S ribosomal protein L24 [Fimbriimonadaceae bacterium]QYK55029.1 MAG: 50S ribosomal protein L24 [Fimbriimonadaceae bacterium]